MHRLLPTCLTKARQATIQILPTYPRYLDSYHEQGYTVSLCSPLLIEELR